jgi:hypothetical protein
MTVYQAIKAMRELTILGIPFSFEFMSYYRSDQSSSGIVQVAKAKLRKRDQVKNNQNAEIMEEYLDLSTNEPKEFYHPSLMMFNGQKLTLN